MTPRERIVEAENQLAELKKLYPEAANPQPREPITLPDHSDEHAELVELVPEWLEVQPVKGWALDGNGDLDRSRGGYISLAVPHSDAHLLGLRQWWVDVLWGTLPMPNQPTALLNPSLVPAHYPPSFVVPLPWYGAVAANIDGARVGYWINADDEWVDIHPPIPVGTVVGVRENISEYECEGAFGEPCQFRMVWFQHSPVDSHRIYRCVSVEAVGWDEAFGICKTSDSVLEMAKAHALVTEFPHRILSTNALREPVTDLGVMAVTRFERIEHA